MWVALLLLEVALPVLVVVLVASLASKPGRVERCSQVALVTAIVGSVIGAAIVVLLVAPRFAPDRYLSTFAFVDEQREGVWFAGILGVCFCLIALVAGLFIVATARQRRGGRITSAVVLALAGLALAALAWGAANQAPYQRYGLHALPAGERARLDGLDPAAAVTTYLTSRDLSVGYWLSAEQSRQSWHEAGARPVSWEHYPPWAVIDGVENLHVTPFADETHPATGTERSFMASYTTVGSGGREQNLFVLSRSPDGPWRVEEIQPL
jgi:hypothetical protein